MSKTTRIATCPFADTYENLSADNPILRNGQRVYDTKNKQWYTGDGITAFNDLTPDGGDSEILQEELERLQYYGDKDIVPTESEYILGSDGSFHVEEEIDVDTFVIPYKLSDGSLVRDIFEVHIRANKIIIPSTVTRFGEYSCRDIKEVIIPKSVKEIDSLAFRDSIITEIIIPKNVEKIYECAFGNTTELKYVYFENDNVEFCYRNAYLEEQDYIFYLDEYYSDDEPPRAIVNPNLTFICNQGSTAEAYAKKYGIKYAYSSINSDEINNKAHMMTKKGGFIAGKLQETYDYDYDSYYNNTKGVVIGLEAGVFSPGESSPVVIGEKAFSSNGGVVIGYDATDINGGVSIGEYAESGGGVSIGYNAKAIGTHKVIVNGEVVDVMENYPLNAIQLGTGTNVNERTFQVYNYQMMDAQGKIPAERLPEGIGGGSAGVSQEELERLNYYGDKDIVPTESEYIIGSDGTLFVEEEIDVDTFVAPYKLSDGSLVRDLHDLNIRANKIIIPSTVTEFRENSFRGIKEVIIPKSVKNIYSSAFRESIITEIIIPKNVEKIYETAFSDTIELKYVYFENDNVEFCHPNASPEDGDYVFYLNEWYSDDEPPRAIVNPNLTFVCNQGSTAEAYAKKYGIKYEYNHVSSNNADGRATKKGGFTAGSLDEDYAAYKNSFSGVLIGAKANASSSFSDMSPVVIGQRASSSDGGVVIGCDAGSINDGVSIGYDAQGGSVSIGYNAKAIGTHKVIVNGEVVDVMENYPLNAIQLGTGTNVNERTFQVYNYQMMDAQGKIPEERISNMFYLDGDNLKINIGGKTFTLTPDSE